MDNEERANRALSTLEHYSTLIDSDEKTQTLLIDLLADLRHFAAREAINFDNALLISEIYYREE